MTSQTGQQIITIYTLSQEDIQTMKFVQLIQ